MAREILRDYQVGTRGWRESRLIRDVWRARYYADRLAIEQAEKNGRNAVGRSTPPKKKADESAGVGRSYLPACFT